ncbi:hypothetical protein PanWU01x14_141160, partial [Parasponia andersonii]
YEGFKTGFLASLPLAFFSDVSSGLGWRLVFLRRGKAFVQLSGLRRAPWQS